MANGKKQAVKPDGWGEGDAPATAETPETAQPQTTEDRLAVLESAHEELKAEWVAMKKVLTKFGIDLPNEVEVNAQYLASISEETPSEEQS